MQFAIDDAIEDIYKNDKIIAECRQLYTDKELDKPYSHDAWFTGINGVTWRTALDYMARDPNMYHEPTIKIKKLSEAQAFQIYAGTHTIEDFAGASIQRGGRIYTLFHDVDSQYLSSGRYAYYLERKNYWYGSQHNYGDIRLSCTGIKMQYVKIAYEDRGRWLVHPDEKGKHPMILLPI